MKKRRKLPKQTSRRIFSATAQNVHTKNITKNIARGGYRL